jgi:hypothetical protein
MTVRAESARPDPTRPVVLTNSAEPPRPTCLVDNETPSASVVVGADPAELRAQVEAELPEGWRTVSYERRVALIHHAGEIVAHRKAIRELLP